MHVLVTGGSRGIGEAILRLYRDNGYIVDAPARNELDLSSDESIDFFLSEKSDCGYDIIINNAGCNLVYEIDEVPDAAILEMMHVNLLGPIRLLRGLVPYMKKGILGEL